MRVLAVGAHPDDLEILCGGTLARYVEEGHDVVMCHATKGDRGSFEYTSEEVSRIRAAEAARAAEIAGAEYVSLGLSDGEVNAADPEQRLVVVDLVREARPDVILLDLMMPGRTGLDTLAELRADAELAEIPVVMLTGRAQVADREAAEEAGATRFLTKPFSPDELGVIVSDLLATQR